MITYNYQRTKRPTYVAFLDYSTAFPSVHRERLLASLSDQGIVEKMWMHLRARFQSVHIRDLNPGIRERNSVEILRGLPEGSRLSPTLLGIFVAETFDYLGLRLDRGLNMKAAVEHMLEKANEGQAVLLP